MVSLVCWCELRSPLWSALVREEIMVASAAGTTEFFLEHVSPQAWSGLLRGDGSERVWIGHDHPASSWAVRWSDWSVISSGASSKFQAGEQQTHALVRWSSWCFCAARQGSLKLGLISPSADMDERITAPSHQNSSCTFCQRGLASLPTHTDFKAWIFWTAELRKSKRHYKLLQTHRVTAILCANTRIWLETQQMGLVLDWKWKYTEWTPQILFNKWGWFFFRM